jgi:hypothetical protein
MLCILNLVYELSSHKIMYKHMFFLKSEGMVCLECLERVKFPTCCIYPVNIN